MIIEKFKLNKDFRRLYGRGKSVVSPYLVTYVTHNKIGNIRMGITVGKKIGNAVCRNRAKRVITAAFRQNLTHIQKGTDLVFVARTRILSTKSTTVAAHMEQHLKECGVWTK